MVSKVVKTVKKSSINKKKMLAIFLIVRKDKL